MGSIASLVIYLFLYLFTMAYSAFAYIGVSLGGFRMARKVDMPRPWLFWIPVANAYAMGHLADTQAIRCEGKSTTLRKKMVIWSVVLTVAAIIWAVSLGIIGFVAATAADTASLTGLLSVGLITSLMFFVPYIIYLVIYYKSLYRIYKLYAPNDAGGFLVLSIFINVSLPILFLVLSGKAPDLPTPEDTAEAAPDYIL